MTSQHVHRSDASATGGCSRLEGDHDVEAEIWQDEFSHLRDEEEQMREEKQLLWCPGSQEQQGLSMLDVVGTPGVVSVVGAISMLAWAKERAALPSALP